MERYLILRESMNKSLHFIFKASSNTSTSLVTKKKGLPLCREICIRVKNLKDNSFYSLYKVNSRMAYLREKMEVFHGIGKSSPISKESKEKLFSSS